MSSLPVPAQRALAAYRERLAHRRDAGPITVAWASGRANLIGEHTDYNDGYVLPVAIDRVVAIAGRALSRPSARTRCYSVHHGRSGTFDAFPAALLDDDLARQSRRGPLWLRYVRAVLAELAALPSASETPLPPATPAFAAAIAGDVPVGGGLSSSAALGVAVATFASALGGPSLPPMDTACLCQRAEHRGAGVRIGIMDQAASCLGRPAQALQLDCRSLAYEYVPFALPGVLLAVYDTAVPHSLARSGYNERRAQCERSVVLLAPAIAREDPARQIRSLRDVTANDLTRHSALLPDPLLRRARHVVAENDRVLRAVTALRAGETHTLGALLYASHASLRDDYAVSCPELDAVVEIAASVPGVLGARMMGAGFGGSALILVRERSLARLDAALAQEYPRRTGRYGALHICRVGGGPASVTITT
jgi:galactokinase